MVIAQDDYILKLKIDAEGLDTQLNKIASENPIDLSVNAKSIGSAVVKSVEEYAKAAESAGVSVEKVDKAQEKGRRNRSSFIKDLVALASNFKGVQKTLDDGTAAFQRYDEKLLDISKATDTTKKQADQLARSILNIKTRTQVDDLLSLGIAAGKLGIEFDNIPDFVKAADDVFVALGDNINGTAEEIAIGLGKISSTFEDLKKDTPEVALRKVASVINDLDTIVGKADLDNVVKFAEGFSGIANEVGIAADEVLVLGAIIDDSAISVDVAGTALANLIPKIAQSSEEFAKLAGISSEEFNALPAIKQLEAVLLGAQSAEGGIKGLSETLNNLGVSGKGGAAIVSLANNIDKLSPALEEANKSFNEFSSVGLEATKKNTESVNATTEQATRRYETLLLTVNRVTKIFNRFSLRGRIAQATLRGIGRAAAFAGKALKTALTGGVLAAIAAIGNELRKLEPVADFLSGLANKVSVLARVTGGSIVDIFNGIKNGEGVVNSFSKAYDEFGDKVDEGIKVADNMTAAMKRLEVSTRSNLISQAKYNNLIQQFQIQLEKEGISLDEKVNLIQKIALAQDAQIAKQIRLLEIEKGTLNQSILTKEEKDKLAEIEAQIITLTGERASIESRTSIEIVQLVKDQRLAIAALSQEYANLNAQISIDLNSDELKKAQLTAAQQAVLARQQAEQAISDLAELGLNSTQYQDAYLEIEKTLTRQLELISVNLGNSIREISNEVPVLISSLDAFNQFVQTGEFELINSIFSADQFTAIELRIQRILNQLSDIGEIDNVGEFNLSNQLNAELEKLIEILGDSPEGKEIKRLLFELVELPKPEDSGLSPEDYIAFFDQIASAAINLTNTLNEEQIKRLDFEIEIQQRRVELINKSVADGNAEQLQLEENRLNGLIDARERAARRQQQIAAIEVAANQAVAVSAAVANIAAGGNPIFIAAQVAAILAGIVAATAAIDSAFGDIPAFFEGTEYNVARSLGKPQQQGRDGYQIRVDGSEKVLSSKLSKKVGHMTSSKLVDNALKYEKLSHLTMPSNIIYKGAEFDYNKVIQDNKTLIDQNKEIIGLLKSQGTEVVFDEKGLEVSTGKALARLERKRNQYKNDFKGSQGKTKRFRRRI